MPQPRSRNRVAAALLLAAALPLLVTLPAAAEGFEEPPVLRAADRVSPGLLRGEDHEVDPRVVNDGFMNHFTLRSGVGEFQAESEAMLVTRIQEVYAIAKLREVSRSEAFADALKGSVRAPVQAVGSLVTQPVETMKGIPGGVTRKMRGFYYKAVKTGHKVGDEIKDDKSKEAAEGTAEEGAQAEGSAVSSEEVEQAAKKYSGYNSAKREMAQRLRVDPYSTNQVLQEELDRLAKAAFTAGLAFRAAVPNVSALDYVEDAHEMVWTTPPTELERLNNKALKDMGIAKGVRLDFFDNRHYTLTYQTAIVEALKTMQTTAGRGAVIELALQAEDAAVARFLTRSTQILAGYDEHVAPLTELRLVGNEEIGQVVAGLDGAGKLIVPAAFDHLIWQQSLSHRGPAYAFAERQLWLSGDLSGRAEKELESRGWSVQTRAFERFSR